jgi:hypothetical protein
MIDSNNELKKLSKNLIDSVRNVIEGKAHTTPKTDKEKKLAALAEPKNKITHKDVLVGRGVVKEEEQIDELSTGTLKNYRAKAKEQGVGIQNKMKVGGGDWSKDGKDTKTLRKRAGGYNAAGKKLVKRGESLTKEEIEMIEAKLAGVADGSMEGEKHMCATKVFHKEWNEGTPVKTMHADPDENGLIEWYDVMFDHGIERVMTEDMEILQQESHMHSKKKMKEEVEAIDEALDAAARYNDHHTSIKSLMKSISQHVDAHKGDAMKYRDYRGKKGVNWSHVGDLAAVHSQLADVHDRLAQQGDYKKSMAESVELEEGRGRPKLPRDAKGNIVRGGSAAATDEEPAALGYQLRKAASINKPVHFMNGEKKEVSRGHIDRFNDHMAARKSSQEKALFQMKAHKSHADFVKAVSEKVPHSSRDTGEIVKYR